MVSILKFEALVLAQVKDGELGAYLREYLMESDHGGWDGFEEADHAAGIQAFIDDLTLYIMYGRKDRKELLQADSHNYDHTIGSARYRDPLPEEG